MLNHNKKISTLESKMGKGISVEADLTGCSLVFLVLPLDSRLCDLSVKAIEMLRYRRGIGKIKTVTMEQACDQLVKIQERHGNIPDDQKFLKLTARGNITQLFR